MAFSNSQRSQLSIRQTIILLRSLLSLPGSDKSLSWWGNGRQQATISQLTVGQRNDGAIQSTCIALTCIVVVHVGMWVLRWHITTSAMFNSSLYLYPYFIYVSILISLKDTYKYSVSVTYQPIFSIKFQFSPVSCISLLVIKILNSPTVALLNFP